MWPIFPIVGLFNWAYPSYSSPFSLCPVHDDVSVTLLPRTSPSKQEKRIIIPFVATFGICFVFRSIIIAHFPLTGHSLAGAFCVWYERRGTRKDLVGEKDDPHTPISVNWNRKCLKYAPKVGRPAGPMRNSGLIWFCLVYLVLFPTSTGCLALRFGCWHCTCEAI